MGFKHEVPLRGWKEILTFIGVNDYRTATKILIEKKVLKYEGNTPVILASEYLKTLKK
jgi:hypothetical protein